MPTSRLQVSFLRTPGSHEEDVAVMTMHFQDAAGQLLTGAQMEAVEGQWTTFWTPLSDWVHPYVVPEQFRWYDQQVWPTLSPLLRVTPATLGPGTSVGGALPPQCAMSITFQTMHRKRWGRFYFPGLTITALNAAEGRVLTTAVNAFADQGAALVRNCRTNGANPVVWSPRGGKGPPIFAAGDVELITSVRADDIVDIVRRRRWQDSPYHHVVPV